MALSAGIGASSANFASIVITPDIRGYTASDATDVTDITVAGDISVAANASPKAFSETIGVNAGALAVGASISLVETSPDVFAHAGGRLAADSDRCRMSRSR